LSAAEGAASEGEEAMQQESTSQNKKVRRLAIHCALAILMGLLVLLAQSTSLLVKSTEAQSPAQGYWKLGEIKKVNNLKPDVPGGWHYRADMSDGSIEYSTAFNDSQYKYVATWPSAPAALIPGQEVTLSLSLTQAMRKGGFSFNYELLARFDGFGVNIGYSGCGADFIAGKDKHAVHVDTSQPEGITDSGVFKAMVPPFGFCDSPKTGKMQLNVEMANGPGGFIYVYSWQPGTPSPSTVAPKPPVTPAPPVSPRTPPAPTETKSKSMMAPTLGPVLTITEAGVWQGTWTRRPGTNIFDATWRGPNGQIATDVIEIVSAEGNKIIFKRKGNNGTYTGTLSPGGTKIAGSASWYSPGQQWTGMTSGNPTIPSPVKSIAGEWTISTAGIVGGADEKKALFNGSLMISGAGTNLQGKLLFSNIGAWEPLTNVAFDGTILRFTRPHSAWCTYQQNYEARIAGDRLQGTFTHLALTLKWWGEKKNR
jgi:hypothetical protein